MLVHIFNYLCIVIKKTHSALLECMHGQTAHSQKGIILCLLHLETEKKKVYAKIIEIIIL